MKLKQGVVFDLKEGILRALPVIEHVWLKYGQEPVITAGTDGKHMKGSKHYSGDAVDVRSRFFDAETTVAVAKDLAFKLGSEFDVVNHVGSHIHIEYDPK
jgi:hypothetical protein